jgi:hypothetical protein
LATLGRSSAVVNVGNTTITGAFWLDFLRFEIFFLAAAPPCMLSNAITTATANNDVRTDLSFMFLLQLHKVPTAKPSLPRQNKYETTEEAVNKH